MFYIYDQKTKEFTHETEGQPNPKVPGEFFTPSNSTEIDPPAEQINKKAAWDDTQWNLLDDYRDQFYWLKADGSKVEFELGDGIDDTMTDKEPVENTIWDSLSDSWVPNPEHYRDQKHQELRENAIDASEEPVSAIGFFWNGGEESRDRMLAKASHMESKGIIESESWDIDNVMHLVSAADVREISDAITQQIELVGHHYRTKKNEYLACQDDVVCINNVIW